MSSSPSGEDSPPSGTPRLWKLLVPALVLFLVGVESAGSTDRDYCSPDCVEPGIPALAIVCFLLAGVLTLVTIIGWGVRLGVGRSRHEAAPTTADHVSSASDPDAQLEQIRRLAELRRDGTLSEDEFTRLKQQILGD